MNDKNQYLLLGGGVALAVTLLIVAFVVLRPADPPTDEVAEIGETQPGAERDGPTVLAESAYRTLDGGLKVADLVEGQGDSPVAGQFIDVHYTGWLQSDGKKFDSSIPRGEPFSFQLETGGVIKGWHKGIAGMKVGGKRQLVIPPDLAYGPAGRPPTIPPSSTLVFEVELIALGEVRSAPEFPQVDWSDGKAGPKGITVIDPTPGTGDATQERGPVMVDLSVWQESGELFFSTLQQARPLRFMVGGDGRDAAPLEGIDLAVRDMQVGGRRLAKLPPEVAFGDRGFRDQIPPNATIVVQIDLVEAGAPRVPPKAAPWPSGPKQGLTTTDSGLQYVDLELGEGATPNEGEVVYAEYTGWLDDGKMFDSSYNRSEPFMFAIGRGMVIKAWDEALASMRPGGKRIIVAPPELAYGGAGKGDIPPNSTLTFLVELVRVESK